MSGDLFATAQRARASARQPERRVAAPVVSGDDEHKCVVCGQPAGFGFDVFLRRGREGRWACLGHRDDVEAMSE